MMVHSCNPGLLRSGGGKKLKTLVEKLKAKRLGVWLK
jgi:hypothetical protein